MEFLALLHCGKEKMNLYSVFSQIMFYSLQRNTQDWLVGSAGQEKRVLQPMKKNKSIAANEKSTCANHKPISYSQ